MKTIITSLFFLIMTSSISAQTQSDCESSWGLNHYYKWDVAYLTFKRLYEIKSSDTNKIIIPQVHQDTVWNGLAAIYNAFAIYQRDSIFDIFCVHKSAEYGSPLYPAIKVELDTTFNWTSYWLNGEINSGYTALDSFMNEYDYSIQIIYENSNTVIINSNQPINPNPVIDSLLFFEGIIDAYPFIITSNGNEIEYRKIGNEQFFDFTLAWGDCPSGCVNRHKWKFKVNHLDCIVEYLGLESYVFEEFPNPSNCNITSIEYHNNNPTNLLLIYPNPTSDFLTIECKNIIQVELWNYNRLIIRNEYKKQDFIKLDLRSLKSGLYFIKVKTEKEMLIRKVIKHG